MIKKLLILSFLLSCITAFSQDTIPALNAPYQHNRKKAAILSAVLPGSGQIYNEIGYRKFAGKKNRAWWKVPIIYGGLGACGYYFYQNKQTAALLRQEYEWRKTQPVPDDANLFYDERFKNYESTDALINGYSVDVNTSVPGFDLYSKRRDYFLIGFMGVWALNIIEAYVDAHFVTFDVNEDLSMSWSPTVMYNSTPGLKLRFDFN